MAVEQILPELGEIPVFPVQKLALHDWHDGLLIRSPNWLGDAVMTLPALAVLRKLIPAPCGLFVACPKGIAPLFQMLPDLVDQVIPLTDPHAFPTSEERHTVRWLCAGAGLLFNNSFRDALWMKWARIPKLYGTDARFRSLLLERAYSFPPRLDHTLNHPHQAAKYLAMAMAMGAPQWDGIMPAFTVPYEPEIYPEDVLSALHSERLLALAPGAAYGAAKRWDTDRFREVAAWWIDHIHGEIALLCSGKEAEEARKTLDGLNVSAIYDLAGKTTLETLVLVLQHSRLCIANDSGIMHLAAVLGTPGIVPFGSTDPAATSPLSSRWRILFDKRPCAPCFKRVCPKGTRECMKVISAADVIKAAEELNSQYNLFK